MNELPTLFSRFSASALWGILTPPKLGVVKVNRFKKLVFWGGMELSFRHESASPIGRKKQ